MGCGDVDGAIEWAKISIEHLEEQFAKEQAKYDQLMNRKSGPTGGGKAAAKKTAAKKTAAKKATARNPPSKKK